LRAAGSADKGRHDITPYRSFLWW